MEIETKIFDTKKVRKVLKRLKMEPKCIIDIVDYFFDLQDFSTKNWRYLYPRGTHSGLLGMQGFSVEIPDSTTLREVQDFCSRYTGQEIKIRLRVLDTIPYITFKGPKKTKKGIKSREEIELRIGSLSRMLQILLDSGALFTKCITRVREVYKIPHHNAELVLDTLYSAHGNLEYAELECASVRVLRSILADVFRMTKKDISHVGISDLYDEKWEKIVTKKLKYLAQITQK